jgi:predicted transposase YbfD/YdcC
MSKIDEILKLQQKTAQIKNEIIDKIDELNLITEKYIFSVSIEKGFCVNIRNKSQDITLTLDRDEIKVLYDFLQSLLEESKQKSKDIKVETLK